MDSSVRITKLIEPSVPPPPPPVVTAPTTTATTTSSTPLHQQQPSHQHHLNNNHPHPTQNQHQQQVQLTYHQHPLSNSNSNSTSTSTNSLPIINNNERYTTNFATNKQRMVPPPTPPTTYPSKTTATTTTAPTTATTLTTTIVATPTTTTTTTTATPINPSPQPSSANVESNTKPATTIATIITRPATIITTNVIASNANSTNQIATTMKGCINHNNLMTTAPSTAITQNKPNHQMSNNLAIFEVDSFFENERYNSCQAVEDLIRSIEESQNETLARRALNLYQRHYNNLDRPWDNETFMYGFGLIYMHFNAYNWAAKSFRETVYVHPSFQRSRDVHTRLGLIFKTTGRYKLSEKHFRMAIHDTRLNSGTSTDLELKFHLAHLSEIQGNTQQAIEAYEQLLQEKDLPPKLSANINRQLGWIHYYKATRMNSSVAEHHNNPNESRRKGHDVGASQQTDHRKLDTALNHLNTAYKIDSDSQTSYYLGRCLTNAGKVRDAFAFYKSVKDKEETNADTWCSMGVLYHRQNQPLDALQAYIRSVQYDKKHTVAWRNLGILYESHNYLKDALKCYQHVLRSSPQGDVDKSLRHRISCIQQHLKEMETSNSSNGNYNGKSDNNSDKLLSLEDLWNMESKTNQESSPSYNSNSYKSDHLINRQTTFLRLSSSQPGTELHADQDNNSKSSSDPSLTNKREENHLQSTNLSTGPERGADRLCNGQTSAANHYYSVVGPTSTACQKLSDERLTYTEVDHKQNSSNLDSLIDRKHEQPSITSDLDDLELADHKISMDITTHRSHNPQSQSMDTKEFSMNQMYTNGASKDSGISSDSSTYTDYALVPSHSCDTSIASYFSAEQVIRSCRNDSSRIKKIDINLISDDTKPPSPLSRSPAYPPLPSDRMSPLAPSIFLDSKKDITSKKLQETCQSNPISVLRNVANILKLDLGLFSTKTLTESNPDQQIDIVSHLVHLTVDGTNEESLPKNLWSCERQKSTSTISNYASYQVASFKQSLMEERNMKAKPATSVKESETDSNESGSANRKNASDAPGMCKQSFESRSSKSGPASKKLRRDEDSCVKQVKSANMIDLSCEKNWRPQINELNKLPYFLKCVSASNMLTHIGTLVPGLNTNTVSMHVPGCRFVGNRAPNLMCSMSLNIGPGEYDWCAIPGEYERVLKKLCNRNGFIYEEENWWPLLDDLHRCNVPVYRFSQRPGDLVWINSSTIYWVQAVGWTNSIRWNLGPLCARQYQLTAESCELDKLLFQKSQVPMVQMTWNLVMNISIIQDEELFHHMINIMRRSLRYCRLIIDLCDDLKRDIHIADGEPGPRSFEFCSLCECEVFNITFRLKQDSAIYCIECALRSDTRPRRLSSDYKIDQVYDLSFLMQLYDNFIENKRKFQARQFQLFQQQQQQQQQQKQQQRQQQKQLQPPPPKQQQQHQQHQQQQTLHQP